MKDNSSIYNHFPADVGPELKEYITNQVMDWSVYLFTYRSGRKQFAFCTHCKQEHQSEGLKHGQKACCPHCNSSAHVKASGRGRSNLRDQSYLLWYEKSVLDPNILIARGIYSTRDYRGDYRITETESRVIAMYVFEWGKPGRMMRRFWWSDRSRWEGTKKTYSETKQSMSNIPSYHSVSNMAEAVKGTPFQYCTWEQYDIRDRVEVFDFASRYKCMEFLTKSGLGHLVQGKIEGLATYGAINWTGDTPMKVLRMSKSEIKDLIQGKHSVGFRTIRSYQLHRKEGFAVNWQEALMLGVFIEKDRTTILNQLSRSAPLNGEYSEIFIKKYLLKQIRNNERHYGSHGHVLIEYQDYLKECVEIGLDTSKTSVLFPNNLQRAHQKTMKQVKVIRNEKHEQQIIRRAQHLARFSFKYKDLMLFPAGSINDLVNEGKLLQHCVGGYVEKYASGKSDIFFVRKKDKPGEPFYTMEIANGRVVQCRGHKNKAMSTEVSEFVTKFEAMFLKKSKIKQNQGVAV